MKIFLDTANIEQIKQGAKLGVVSGVTTNPSLVSREGTADYEAVVKEICTIIPGPVSAEVVVEGASAMIQQARKIATWAPNMVIKIPATAEGLEVTSTLARENIKVNLTLCFSLNQALLGALAGLLAAAGSELIAYIAYTQVFNLEYAPKWPLWLLLPPTGAILIGAAGFWGTRRVVRESPLTVLKEA